MTLVRNSFKYTVYYRILYSLILCIFYYYTCLGQPPWNSTLDLTQIEHALMHEKVISRIPIAEYLTQKGYTVDFSNEVDLITLESGLQAVFKPGESRFAEVVAFRAALFLGHHLVPPTVFRTIDGKAGSMSFFVEPHKDLIKTEVAQWVFENMDPKDLSDMKLFYFIFGQWDIGSANQIVQIHNGRIYIALIDNTAIGTVQQARYGDFAFVARGYSEKRNDPAIPFPFDTPQTLQNPTIETVLPVFGEFLSKDALTRLCSHHRKAVCYVIWQNRLWIQYYKYNASVSPNYTAIYYQSTLDAYKKLSKEILEEFWKEALQEDKQYYTKIIENILERKEQVIKYPKKVIY